MPFHGGDAGSNPAGDASFSAPTIFDTDRLPIQREMLPSTLRGLSNVTTGSFAGPNRSKTCTGGSNPSPSAIKSGPVFSLRIFPQITRKLPPNCESCAESEPRRMRPGAGFGGFGEIFSDPYPRGALSWCGKVVPRVRIHHEKCTASSNSLLPAIEST